MGAKAAGSSLNVTSTANSWLEEMDWPADRASSPFQLNGYNLAVWAVWPPETGDVIL
jgi:hypothetical protein